LVRCAGKEKVETMQNVTISSIYAQDVIQFKADKPTKYIFGTSTT